jgi:hypothetical protein
VKNILDTTARVSILEQNSTNGGVSWFMVSRVNIEWREEKVVSEVFGKYDVCS